MGLAHCSKIPRLRIRGPESLRNLRPMTRGPELLFIRPTPNDSRVQLTISNSYYTPNDSWARLLCRKPTTSDSWPDSLSTRVKTNFTHLRQTSSSLSRKACETFHERPTAGVPRKYNHPQQLVRFEHLTRSDQSWALAANLNSIICTVRPMTTNRGIRHNR